MSDKLVLVHSLEANIRRQAGQHEEALRLLDLVAETQFDDDGFEYDASMFAQQRAECLAALGRHFEAADALLDAMADSGVLDAHLGTVVEYLEVSGRPLSDVADALPQAQLRPFLAQVLQLRDDVADRVLTACMVRRPADALVVMATGATLARRLPVERALSWSAVLRERGLDDACPLVAIAATPGRPTVERARAAAAGYRTFEDTRLADAFVDVAASASPEEREAIAAEATLLCPALLDRLAVVAGGR